MKKNLRTALMFAAFCVFTGSSAVCFGQPGRIVGGYGAASKTDEAVVAAADFAVGTQAKKDRTLKLVSVKRAERQIVAGSNYRLCLALNSKNKAQEASAVVYLNLQNEFSLTSWTAGKCGDDAATTKTAAVSTNAAIAPVAIVRNLYAAQKNPATSPFFQAKKRALVDKYFTKELADLLWKDVEGADGVGNLDFDPLYNAQDTKITAFKIGKPEYGEGNAEVADVAVTFKNMGKDETVLFRLEQIGKTWKIGDIYYPGNEGENASLKSILAR